MALQKGKVWLMVLCLLFVFAQILRQLLHDRRSPCFIAHIRSHSNLPGYLAEGNARADAVLKELPVVASIFDTAIEAHSMFHLPASVLHKKFAIPLRDARDIVGTCLCVPNILLPLPLKLLTLGALHQIRFGRWTLPPSLPLVLFQSFMSPWTLPLGTYGPLPLREKLPDM